jgi:uncharacterized protein YbbC (DUF1343 family)
MKNIFLLVSVIILSCNAACKAQSRESKFVYKLQPADSNTQEKPVLPGAYGFYEYLPILKGKKVALVVNQTSEVNGVLLPDTLLQLGVNIVKIFSPEHGFRGQADAGAKVNSSVDQKTGLPIISLYGKNKKPSSDHLNDVDIVVYDLQDVGARFYTYISTLEYVMEACGENKKTLIVLDRPNPLGNIVDGPVLESAQKSFVGMQSIPVVYGMTAGEYASMLIGERWINNAPPHIEIIKCQNYDHNTSYDLPVAPSPNLKNMAAIYLYPSLCFFEGTSLSLGRGTEKPFQQFGHPSLKNYTYSFTPTSMPGASDPPLKGQRCYGKLIASNPTQAHEAIENKLQIKWLLEAYKNFPEKGKFFNSFFDKLAGTTKLKAQIISGADEATIRASWQKDLNHFKSIRKKYLLYTDFE